MLKAKIKEAAYHSGADICGIASIERFNNVPEGFHPTDIFKDTKSVIVIARRFPRGSVKASTSFSYSISDDIVTGQIREITYNTSILLEDLGVTPVPVYTEPYRYWNSETMTGKGDLSLKHAGYLAGIGVFGKNQLLYNYKYGNMIKLGALLIDAEIEPDEIQTFSFCKENCFLCIKNCPSGALGEETVDQKKCRLHSEGLSSKGYPITTCSTCRTICPFSSGVSLKHKNIDS